MNFSNEKQYREYFEALATSHVDIESFVFGDSKHFSNVQKSGNHTGITLWLDHYPPIRGVGDQDNPLGRLTAEWVVMKSVSGKQQTKEEMDIILDKCESIAQDIFAKIMYDYQVTDSDNQPDWPSRQFGRMESYLFSSTTYEGTACQMDFLINAPATYNENKWL